MFFHSLTLSLSVKANRTNGTFGFFPTDKPTLKKPKEPFFSNARQKNTK
jgi:hypothetical protein